MNTLDTAAPSISAQVAKVRHSATVRLLDTIDARATQLRALRDFLVTDGDLLAAALHSDLGKSRMEADLTEIMFTINEIDHTLSNLTGWAAPQKVSLPLHFRPGSARVIPEPLGCVLIIAPWNYPLQLVLAPLVAALAAGNTAILKPSEIAPATAAAIADRLHHYVDDRAVQVVTGGVPETTELLEQRFDHIFYTGNGTVGKIVMQAAAEHLTPVTLELGGKSPAIVSANASLAVAARRIAWGKWTNAGQTCVAPDYVLVEESVAEPFVEHLRKAVDKFFGGDPSTAEDYGRIVSERHFDRLQGLFDGGGFAATAFGGTTDRSTRYFAPTAVVGVEPDAPLMGEEIFGPILPILTYRALDEAIDFVNERPKPLALYSFSESDAENDRVVDLTSSGGVTVNHTLMHLAVPDFPFGGVGPSGMGSYHGEHGFRTFSNMKPVLTRGTRPDPSLAYPPYTGLKAKILRKLF